jgi:hypothetical protein
MRAKAKKTWVYVPPKPAKPTIPETLKQQVQAEADRLIEQVLKPKHVQPPEEHPRFNYITDLFTKWHRSYFYFCSTYASPGPYALSPSFESRFARLEYIGNNLFNLAFMRHTGQWWEFHTEISLEEALEAIRDEPHFAP